MPVFKQYREADGRFYFKLLDAQGQLLLQSLGFDSPREAAQTVRLLQTQGTAALAQLHDKLAPVPDTNNQALAGALLLLAQTASETSK